MVEFGEKGDRVFFFTSQFFLIEGRNVASVRENQFLYQEILR
jgi:hypothetical protein